MNLKKTHNKTKIMDQETIGNTLISQTHIGINEDQTVSLEHIVVVPSAENSNISGGVCEKSKARVDCNALGSSKVLVKEGDMQSCVIDENWDEEKVCRICQLNAADESAECKTDLIQLGCGCKAELGAVHSHCAEAWFKLKGNRSCEICGETAKNVRGVRDNRFMDEWNENRLAATAINGNRGCWQSRSFCNFLMACLVIAFVLPWFFRINMF